MHSTASIDAIAFINPLISLITGKFKMTEEQIGLPIGTLPPKELAELGQMAFLDSSQLSTGVTIKRRVERLLDASGMRTPCGWAIKLDKLDSTLASIEAQQPTFFAWKKQLIASLDVSVAKWAKLNPKYSNIILANAVNGSYIDQKVDFDIHIMKVDTAAKESSIQDANKRLEESLPKSLCEAISVQARIVFKDLDITGVTVRKAQGFVDTILDKIEEFSFLNKSFSNIENEANLLFEFMEELKKKEVKNIKGTPYWSKTCDFIRFFLCPHKMSAKLKNKPASIETTISKSPSRINLHEIRPISKVAVISNRRLFK
jgi:hypothetical protein